MAVVLPACGSLDAGLGIDSLIPTICVILDTAVYILAQNVSTSERSDFTAILTISTLMLSMHYINIMGGITTSLVFTSFILFLLSLNKNKQDTIGEC